MNLDEIARRNEERRASFSMMLKNGDDVEKIRAAALEYFDDKISETEDAVDFACGPELEIACIMQKRYKSKRIEVENAATATQIVAIVG